MERFAFLRSSAVHARYRPTTVWIVAAWLLVLASMPSRPVLAQRESLPWAKSDTAPRGGKARELKSARELFINMETSQWEMFRDDRPLHADEFDSLTRVLFRLPLIGEYPTYRLARPISSWETFQGEVGESRGEFFRIRGTAKRIARVELIPEVVRRFQFEHYYLVTLQPNDTDFSITIAVREIPEHWPIDQEFAEPTSTEAVFLKRGEEGSADQRFVFAAQRLAWYPEQVSEERGVHEDMLVLSRLGMDISRFADIRKRDGLPLDDADTACFYQLLSACRELDPDEVAAHAPALPLAEYLQKPQLQHGKLARITGRAKRLTKITLNSPDLQQRYGIDHYYEVDIMLPLGDQEVRLPRNANDKEAPVITNSYPIICCVLDVPARLKTVADQSELNEDMTIVGFNFRLWSFQSQFLDEQARTAPVDDGAEKTVRRRQPSPMFLAPRADFAPPRPQPVSDLGTYLGGILIVIIVAVGAISFWTRNRDAAARKRLRALGQD